MKRMLLLTMTMFFVGLFLGSVALARDFGVFQGATIIDGQITTIIDEIAIPLTTGPTTGITVVADVYLAPSGGPSILLPGAALLLGTGVLIYSVLRRCR